MTILNDIQRLEKVYSAKELEQQFSLKELKSMYKRLQGLDEANDELFVRFLNKNEQIDRTRIERMWFMKNNIKKLHELLVKAISSIEQAALLTQTDHVTTKLRKLVNLEEEVSNDKASEQSLEKTILIRQEEKKDNTSVNKFKPQFEESHFNLESSTKLDKDISFDFNDKTNSQFGSQFGSELAKDNNSLDDLHLDMDTFNAQFEEPKLKENSDFSLDTSVEFNFENSNELKTNSSQEIKAEDFSLDVVSFDLPPEAKNEKQDMVFEMDFNLDEPVNSSKPNDELSLEFDLSDFSTKK